MIELDIGHATVARSPPPSISSFAENRRQIVKERLEWPMS
jgi:hypothetical protein